MFSMSAKQVRATKVQLRHCGLRVVSDNGEVEAYVTPKRLAEELDVSVFQLKQWRERGSGPLYYTAGSEIRYPIGLAVSWMKTRYYLL